MINLIIILILIISFILIALGDVWSTYYSLRYNDKYMSDKRFRQKVQKQFEEKLNKDRTSVEMSGFAKLLMMKLGYERALLYLGVFGYGPIALCIFYMLLTDFNKAFAMILLIIGFMFGMLYGQIFRALTLKKRFGIDIKTMGVK